MMPSFLICVLVALCLTLPSCTLSFENISTHGTATDLVDENQAATATVTAQAP